MVSVIVPVFRVEKYLHQCVDSILNQTYKDLEIILVDDGSDDNCGRIIDEYEKKDSRVQAFHKPNGGLSSARNYGIDRAHGEYLMFVDSDDYIEPDMVKTLVSNLQKSDTDISVCEYNIVTENGAFIKKHNRKSGVCVYTAHEALCSMFYRDRIGWNAWNKLYKKSLFDGIYYPEGVICEDMAITYQLYFRCQRVVYDRKALYNYRMRDNSISGLKNLAYYTTPLNICEEMMCFFSGTGDEKLHKFAAAYAVKHAFLTYLSVYGSAEYEKLLPECLSIIKRYLNCLPEAEFLPFYRKAAMGIVCLFAIKDNLVILNLNARVFQKIRKRLAVCSV